MVADEKPAFVPAEPVAEADGTSDLENMTESAEEAAGEDALSALRAELAEQTAKAKEHLDQWKRTAADFANYRKRQMKEQEQMIKRANASLIMDLLPVLDDLERALDGLDDGEKTSSWAQGVQLVEHKLQATLSKAGLEEIAAGPGTPFDPNLYEAIFHEESAEYPEGTIMGVMRKGYKLGDRLLRAAMVRVAKAPSVEAESADNEFTK